MHTADITENDLDQLAMDTLAETQETPHTKADESPTWKPRGAWSRSGSNPVELGIDGRDTAVITLRFQTTQPARQSILALRDDLARRARSSLLASFQQHEGYQRWSEANAEHRLALLRLDELNKKAAELAAEHLKLTLRPKGAGARLVSLKQQQEETARRLEAAQAEVDCLKPLADDARQAVEIITRQLSQHVSNASNREHLASIDAALADFAARNSETLTELAAMVQARKGSIQAYELTTFALAQLHDPQPSSELLNATDD